MSVEIKRVAVLGAGYMGSAITFPLSHNDIAVNLWGTWLDDDIVRTSEQGPHPKLGRKLPESVRLFMSDRLTEAVSDVDAVFVGVTSEGFIPVFSGYLEAVREPLPVFTLTKGFADFGDTVTSIYEAGKRLSTRRFGEAPMDWVSIGGPVKAVELAGEIPTATVYGGSPGLGGAAASFSTDYYRVFRTHDMRGVELCSAFKNVYAIVMGVCDGLFHGSGTNYHNLKSFIYNQAVRELAIIVSKLNGLRETAFDLAGVGDLYVTAASGRNGRFGSRIGMGGKPDAVYDEMKREGEIAEGYHTLALGRRYLQRNGFETARELPLFEAVHAIIFGNHDPRDELYRFAAGCC